MVQDALAQSKQRRTELLKKLQGDGEVYKKITDQGMQVDYSPEDDYLTITIGRPQPSISLPTPSGAYLLMDPDSGELNAIEVPFFLEVFKGEKLQGRFWDLVADQLATGRTSVYIPPHKDQNEAEKAFRDLVPA